MRPASPRTLTTSVALVADGDELLAGALAGARLLLEVFAGVDVGVALGDGLTGALVVRVVAPPVPVVVVLLGITVDALAAGVADADPPPPAVPVLGTRSPEAK
jgi:hypothetical protein